MTFYRGFKFKHAQTWLHRLDPRAKFLVAVLMAGLSLVFDQLIPLLIVFSSLIPLAYSGRVLRELFTTLKGLSFLAALIFAVNLVFIFLGSTKPLEFPAAMTVRFIVLVSAFSIFFLVTPPDEFSLALQRSRIPFDIVFALTMAMRFVPVLASELQSIADAQRSRGLELDKGNFILRIKRRIPLLIPLIVNSVRRSLEIAEAMESRGYGSGIQRTSLYTLRFGKKDFIVIILTILLAALTIYVKLYVSIPFIL
jgi:energy-coupling factor transport system permease protein